MSGLCSSPKRLFKSTPVVEVGAAEVATDEAPAEVTSDEAPADVGSPELADVEFPVAELPAVLSAVVASTAGDSTAAASLSVVSSLGPAWLGAARA